MENKLARFFRATGLARFLLPLGLVLIVMGAFLGFNAPKELTETVGSVTRSEAYHSSATPRRGRSTTAASPAMTSPCRPVRS